MVSNELYVIRKMHFKVERFTNLKTFEIWAPLALLVVEILRSHIRLKAQGSWGFTF